MSFGNNHSYSIIVLRAAVALDASHQHSYLLSLFGWSGKYSAVLSEVLMCFYMMFKVVRY